MSGAVSIRVSFYFDDFSCIVSIAHPRLYHHRNSVLLKRILKLGNSACGFQGVNFVPEFFGVCWKCYGLFCFWFLPPFDNPCNLKFRVSPNPPGFGFLCMITVSPIARAWLVKGGTECTCPPLSFLQSVFLVVFLTLLYIYWILGAILTGMCFRIKQHCGIYIMWCSLSCWLRLYNITGECDIVCSRNLF